MGVDVGAKVRIKAIGAEFRAYTNIFYRLGCEYLFPANLDARLFVGFAR